MRKRLFRENTKFFHVNLDFICHPLFKELDWIFLQTQIESLLHHYKIQLYALVMLDTHIHLLIQSDAVQENFFCEHLMANLKKNQDHIEFHCEPVLSYPQFLNVYKYIYRNPVEAGLVEQVEDYPYSTLQILMGRRQSYCSITDHMGLVQNPFHHLQWLNNQKDFKYSSLKEFREDQFLN